MSESTPLMRQAPTFPWAMPPSMSSANPSPAAYPTFGLELNSGIDPAMEKQIPSFSDDDLDEMARSNSTSITFRWRLLLAVLPMIAVVASGVGHYLVEHAGAPLGELGTRWWDFFAAALFAVFNVVLLIWSVRHYRSLPQPRLLSNFLNPRAETTNIVAWFMRWGWRQWFVFGAVLVECLLNIFVPVAVVLCQRAVELPTGGSVPTEPCTAGAFQLPPWFEKANCQPCVDITLYVANAALYCTAGAVLVFCIVLAIAPSDKAWRRTKTSYELLCTRYPLGNAMVIRSEQYAREKLNTHEQLQGRVGRSLLGVTVLCLSLLIFVGVLAFTINRKVQAKLAAYPHLPIELHVPWMWFSVILGVLAILMSLIPLSDLIVYVVPFCISEYVEPQVINFTAYINPTVRLGLANVPSLSLGNKPVSERNIHMPDGSTIFAHTVRPSASVERTDSFAVGGHSYGAEYTYGLAAPPAPSSAGLHRRATAAALQSGRMSALETGPTEQFGFFSNLANAGFDTSLGGLAAGANSLRLVVNIDGREIPCPVDNTADAITVLIASERYLYNWVAARRFQQRSVLNCTLAPVGFLILVVFVIGCFLFLVVLIAFLIPNHFQLSAALEPASSLSLYVSVYALVSATVVAMCLISLVDQTEHQVRPCAYSHAPRSIGMRVVLNRRRRASMPVRIQTRHLHSLMHLFLGRSDIFSVTPAVQANEDYIRAHEALAAFIRHAVEYVDNHSNELQFLGVPLRSIYIKSFMASAVAELVVFTVSLINSIGKDADQQ